MLTQEPDLFVINGARENLPLLVFLPGMDGSVLSLRKQLNGLNNRFEVRCFCIPSDDVTDWTGLAAQLIEPVTAAKTARPERPIYLCGESFGACLALQAVSDACHLFDRLILINPASSFRYQLWSPLGAMLVRWMPDSAYPFSAFGLLPFLISMTRVTWADQQALVQAMQKVTPETAAWRISLLNKFQLNEAALRRFSQPVLLVASAADQLLPSVAEVKKLATFLSHATTVILEHSGHACLLEAEINLGQLLEHHLAMAAV